MSKQEKNSYLNLRFKLLDFKNISTILKEFKKIELEDFSGQLRQCKGKGKAHEQVARSGEQPAHARHESEIHDEKRGIARVLPPDGQHHQDQRAELRKEIGSPQTDRVEDFAVAGITQQAIQLIAHGVEKRRGRLEPVLPLIGHEAQPVA